MRYLLVLISLISVLSLEGAEPEKKTGDQQATSAVDNDAATQPVQNNILGMNVRGNKESPMTLTIVPWRSASHQVKDPELSPAWRPQLSLLQPEAYRRDINAFLKIRSTKK